jgi:hypothetical protein
MADDEDFEKRAEERRRKREERERQRYKLHILLSTGLDFFS